MLLSFRSFFFHFIQDKVEEYYTAFIQLSKMFAESDLKVSVDIHYNNYNTLVLNTKFYYHKCSMHALYYYYNTCVMHTFMQHAITVLQTLTTFPIMKHDFYIWLHLHVSLEGLLCNKGTCITFYSHN